jgi:hypothetical protein
MMLMFSFRKLVLGDVVAILRYSISLAMFLGDKRYIKAAQKTDLKPVDLSNINFLRSAKGPEDLISTKDSLLAQIGNTHFYFQSTKTKDLYPHYHPFLS